MVREELLADVVVSRESNGGCDWLMLKRGRNDSKTAKKVIKICENNSKGKKELVL